MKYNDIREGVGRITKQNQTVDVGPNEISIQAKKFGNVVDKDGRPANMPKKIKGPKTNVLFNLGITESLDKEKINNYKQFVNFCCNQLQPNSRPKIKLTAKELPETFGYFDIDDKTITVSYANRHQMDVMRTLAHELVHFVQRESKDDLDGADGSRDENEANSVAGILMRKWANRKPHLFSESVDNDPDSVLYFEQMKENLGEIAEATEIYVDMDGVLADFFGEWAKIMQVDHFTKIDKEHDIKDALQKIRDTDEFWLKLPLLPQAKQLLSLIKQIKGEYNICSSPLADDPRSEPHKREWIEKNLAFFPPKNVYITHNKAQFATKEDGTPNILIDDFGKNINQWESAGGIGFKYKDHKFERTAKAIQQQMNAPVDETKEAPAGTYFTKTGNLVKGTLTKAAKERGARETDPKDKSRSKVPPITQRNNEQMSNNDNQRLIIVMDNGKQYDITDFAGETIKDKWNSFNDAVAKVYAKRNTPVPSYVLKKGGKIIATVKNRGNVYKENFADGKKKGKSRPGRVKRSGASCKGSVTSLRKKAKKASGERAKMYHWCANMKGGRKKKRKKS